MRVLWLGHFVPYPPIGGAPQRSFNLLQRLAARDEVHFCGLSLRGHQATAEDVLKARAEFATFCASVEILPARFASSREGKLVAAARAIAGGRSYGEAWLASSTARRLFARRVAELRPDVVHVDSLMIAGMVPDGVPAVLNHHNVESQMMARRAENAHGVSGWFMRREGAALRAFEQRVGPRYARHLVVSDLDGARLLEILPGARTAIVANGVDTEFFTPGPDDVDPLEFVFSGRMNWYPNEHAMLLFLEQLWPRIKRQEPRARMVVVGMNPTPALQRLAASLPDVTVTGFVPDAREPVRRAAVYVCPILDGGGTRLKVLDALALGKAIVGTPLSVEGIAVTDGVDAVVRPFGDEFVDAAVALLRDATRRAKMARAARDLAVSRYDWAAISDAHRAALAAAAATASDPALLTGSSAT